METLRVNACGSDGGGDGGGGGNSGDGRSCDGSGFNIGGCGHDRIVVVVQGGWRW